jgi:hypothetical protein
MRAIKKHTAVRNCRSEACLRDERGNLIFKVRTHGYRMPRIIKKLLTPLKKWDAWRIGYCARHREDPLVAGFREGRVTPLTVFMTFVYKHKEAQT